MSKREEEIQVIKYDGELSQLQVQQNKQDIMSYSEYKVAEPADYYSKPFQFEPADYEERKQIFKQNNPKLSETLNRAINDMYFRSWKKEATRQALLNREFERDDKGQIKQMVFLGQRWYKIPGINTYVLTKNNDPFGDVLEIIEPDKTFRKGDVRYHVEHGVELCGKMEKLDYGLVIPDDLKGEGLIWDNVQDSVVYGKGMLQSLDEQNCIITKSPKIQDNKVVYTEITSSIRDMYTHVVAEWKKEGEVMTQNGKKLTKLSQTTNALNGFQRLTQRHRNLQSSVRDDMEGSVIRYIDGRPRIKPKCYRMGIHKQEKDILISPKPRNYKQIEQDKDLDSSVALKSYEYGEDFKTIGNVKFEKAGITHYSDYDKNIHKQAFIKISNSKIVSGSHDEEGEVVLTAHYDCPNIIPYVVPAVINANTGEFVDEEEMSITGYQFPSNESVDESCRITIRVKDGKISEFFDEQKKQWCEIFHTDNFKKFIQSLRRVVLGEEMCNCANNIMNAIDNKYFDKILALEPNAGGSVYRTKYVCCKHKIDAYEFFLKSFDLYNRAEKLGCLYGKDNNVDWFLDQNKQNDIVVRRNRHLNNQQDKSSDSEDSKIVSKHKKINMRSARQGTQEAQNKVKGHNK